MRLFEICKQEKLCSLFFTKTMMCHFLFCLIRCIITMVMNMNIAKLMTPKVSTVFLHENNTVRQGLERFMIHGYTAIPVLNDKEQYIGSVTEGDFLRHLLTVHTTDLKMQEQHKIGDIVRRDFCPALQIDADRSQAVEAALNQNFVPIVDGRGVLCGILTRKNLIAYFAQR